MYWYVLRQFFMMKNKIFKYNWVTLTIGRKNSWVVIYKMMK